ncbi:MAG: Hsp33 family molecular chaperone HslO [Gammaproteobacteria bacterium]|nr:Hsp33 family molecular chaperone HslO [Gammaproteobacteria bacterium]MDH4315913.1 Hsp33 family molecular chaperone HslO [Gammaproteobacteria bacterium]MDH5214133.1 Hsp33 family molecular chaperone HslO [Gammaproteobacteria bacterium]MDH5500193.1 Hsp33 family molecular chaperone HslO [Gammaproteobacteria bacterium]
MQSHSDAVIPFVFESLPVRGALIQLQSAWQRMQLGHEYPPPVLEVLGHSAAATGLIAQSLKFDGTITLQINGDGPLSMLVMQCTSELQLRGMASAPGVPADAAFPDLVSNARCAITVDAGAMERPYQGIVEVCGDALADSLENYYLRSAQIPSHLQLVSEAANCGGILLQQMPGQDELPVDDWRRLGFLAATLRSADLGDGVGADLLRKLFVEDDLRVFSPRSLAFHCRCSRKRAAEVLRLLGESDTRSACREQGRVEVTCEYCGRTRRFDAVDIARLFADAPGPASDTVH